MKYASLFFSLSLFLACGPATPQTESSNAAAQADAASAALAKSKANQVECPDAPAGVVLSLPADDAVHPGAPTEWWYYVGHLSDDDGHRYGFELVFFQLQSPEGVVSTNAHFAITDIDRQAYFYDTSAGDSAYQQISNAFDLVVPAGWTAKGGSGVDHLSATSGDYSIDLSARDVKGVMYNWGDGHYPLPDGTANYYYSRPRMALSGTLATGGKKLHVEGKGWFDHEWGVLPFTTWTWYGIQLDTDEQMLMVQVRAADNTTVLATAGNFFGADCTQGALDPSDINMSWQGNWTSDASGYSYPTSYSLALGSHSLSLGLQPVLQDQELQSTIPAGSYREADASVSGTENGDCVSGDAYLENVNMVNLPQ